MNNKGYWSYKSSKGLGLLILLGIYGFYLLTKIPYFYVILIGLVLIIGVIFYFYFKDESYDDYEIKENYIDSKGYERDGYDDSLVHRNIAYEEIYKEGYIDGIYPKRFSEYDVHHIDENKKNNSPENLQILTRKEHKKIHGH